MIFVNTPAKKKIIASMKAQIEPLCIKRYNKSTAYMLSANAFEEYQEYKLQVLRDKIAKGVDSLERGNVLDGDKVFDELMELANG